ncbi:hypothetical protein [Paracoccus siganidrum]|uniref:Uncharacterized protein n=1 Tax=Paracoccus siganidrum TaxID=1276757 RepID=A0A419A7I7_9RHOB|nr:hypothetical protein [Paracoccus siganidrum]RJL16531.1 hypothetical protein D3P05_09190 [Paracoccus siganidrum]RMC29458.1 hypothetical protein C9E82_20100 [Paracoccus siganidrum]
MLLNLDEVLDHFAVQSVEGLRHDDLRKRLHVNSSTISLLLRTGIIASKRVRGPRTRYPQSRVSPQELDRFLARYLPLGLMAHALGTQAKHVAARLDKAEVWPIRLPEHCSKIYLHEEAAPIIAI